MKESENNWNEGTEANNEGHCTDAMFSLENLLRYSQILWQCNGISFPIEFLRFAGNVKY